MILNDPISRFRRLFYDTVATYRITNAVALEYLNDAVRDIKTKRTDLRYDNNDKFETTIPEYLLPIVWAGTTAKVIGDRVRPTSGNDLYFFVCTDPGTTAGGEPTWVYTEGTDQADATVIWQIELITLPDTVLMAIVYYMASKVYETDDDEVGDATKGQYFWGRYLDELGVQ